MHLDLANARPKLLDDAKNLISSRSDIAFTYADINCRCKVKFSQGKELFLDSITDVQDILDENQNKQFMFMEAAVQRGSLKQVLI